MKLMILALLTLMSLIFGCKQDSLDQAQIDQFCQDLNVLGIKIALISANIVNANTTRTIKGGPYKRQVPINCSKGFCEVVEEETSPLLKYEPQHPDAKKNGYVAYPNINLNQEKAAQSMWVRVFETVVESFPVNYKKFFLEDPRAEQCFQKYPNVNADYNFKKYLER